MTSFFFHLLFNYWWFLDVNSDFESFPKRDKIWEKLNEFFLFSLKNAHCRLKLREAMIFSKNFESRFTKFMGLHFYYFLSCKLNIFTKFWTIFDKLFFVKMSKPDHKTEIAVTLTSKLVTIIFVWCVRKKKVMENCSAR
jgi:hypothetical protein